MWQRFQTLFLGIASLLVASLFWCDVAKYVTETGVVEYVRYTDKTIYVVWLSILTFIQVMALGGFKWRMKQFRVTVIATVLCFAFQGWLVYDYICNREALVFSWTALFPLVAAVMDIFAMRNILIDEALVQSANRLRLPRKKR